MSARASGIALALVTAGISGFAVFLNGYAVKRFDDATAFTTAKNGIAAVFLLLLALPVLTSASRLGKPVQRPRSRKDGLLLLALAVVGGSVPFVLFFEGLSRASSTQAAFIHKTLVIWVVLLAVPLLGERLTWAHWSAIALLLAGQVAIAGEAGTIDVGAGELMILGATLLWSIEVVFVKRLLQTFASPLLAAARLGIGTALLLAFVALSGRWGELAGFGGEQWAWALLTGLILTGYVATWYAALARAQAVDVTAVLVLAAIVTALLDAGVKGAPLDVLGLGLIGAGGALIALRALRPLRSAATA